MAPRLIYAIGRFHTALRSELSTRLKDQDLTVPEFTVLSVLSLRSGLSNAQLARRSFVSPQAMNQVLASLEDKELVARQPSPGAGRSAHHRARAVKLTPRGRALVRRTNAIVDDIEEVAFVDMEPEQRAEMTALLMQATVRLRAESRDAS